MSGIVTKVVDGDDNFYHFVYKNNSSTKGNSGDSSEAAKSNGSIQDEQPREFKLVKRDLYLERKNKEAQSAPDYTEIK